MDIRLNIYAFARFKLYILSACAFPGNQNGDFIVSIMFMQNYRDRQTDK